MADLNTLSELVQTLNRATDLREMLETAARQAAALLGLQTSWIFLRDETGVFKLAARHNLPPAITYPGAPWDDTCTCQALCAEHKLKQSGHMVRCSRLRYAVGDKRGLAQHASAPIYNGDELLGMLNVAISEFGRLTPVQQHLLATVASALGTAWARAKLNEQVKVRRVQEQATLLRLSEDLLGQAAIGSALQQLVRVAARLLEAEACAFIEADEQHGCATLLAAHGWRFLPSQGLPLPIDQTNPHLWYLPERSANIEADALDDLPPLLAAQRFRGHLALAVTIGGVPVGTLMVNTRVPRQFLDDEAQLLGLLGSQLAQALERERLHQEALHRQRLEQELELARDIQTSFLPEYCPTLTGYHMSAFYRAARQVGGDFYDFIELPEAGAEPAVLRDEPAPQRPSKYSARKRPAAIACPPDPARLGIVIADVTDKGVPAALFMVLSRTLLRATASDGRSPVAVLQQANRLILQDARSGMFVTTFYGVLEPKTGVLTYGNGGHNYPLVYRAATGEIEPVQALGLVLGIIPEPRFEERSTTLQPGDVLCLYTDGVTEAMNGRRELFDDTRLADVLRHNYHLHPDEIIARILDAVTTFAAGTPQMDDITLIVLKRNA